MSEYGVPQHGELESGGAANPVVPLLREALGQPHPHRALAALAAAGPPAVPALAAALREGDGPVRMAAALALGYMPPHALPVAPDLAAALNDREPDVRWAAARALGALGRQAGRALRHLAKALGDLDGRVRHAAAEALAAIGSAALGAGPPRRGAPEAELPAHLSADDAPRAG
jgi:HEAT repeat protein